MKIDSTLRTFLYLVLLFIIVFVIATCTGCSTDAEAQQTVVSAPPVSLGPDQSARKKNTPALMDALKRYINAHESLKREMLSYESEMDVDYSRVKPILDELTASIAALDKEFANFDKASASEPAKEGSREDHSVSRSRDVERPYYLLTGFP